DPGREASHRRCRRAGPARAARLARGWDRGHAGGWAGIHLRPWQPAALGRRAREDRPRAGHRRRHRGEDRTPRRSSAPCRHRRSRYRHESYRLPAGHRRLQPRARVSGRVMTDHQEVTPVSDAPPANPYIPNSAPDVKSAMLAAVGADTVDELYGSIPERLRVPGLLDMEPALRSEYELRRHVTGVLDRNQSSSERLSFLGGGCWPHYVPAVCDEIVNRGEFLTAYYGDTYGDHGKMQALFEYASMLGELVECDAVSQPTYDWGAAAATSISMAARITGRRVALVPASIGAERR